MKLHSKDLLQDNEIRDPETRRSTYKSMDGQETMGKPYLCVIVLTSRIIGPLENLSNYNMGMSNDRI